MNSRLVKLLVATSVFATAAGPYGEFALAAKEYETTSSESAFLDLKQVSSAQRQAILEAAELGILIGGPDGRFRPQSTLTRQELAVVLTRILKLEVISTSHSSFKDVTSRTWGRNHIEAVAKAGLMKGDAQKQFRVNAPVTRQELAAVLVQAAKGAHTNTNEKFMLQDEKAIGPWAKKSVQAVLGNGWMEPVQGYFFPKQAVNRQEIAAILMEAFYPDHMSGVTRTIQHVSEEGVTINGYTYAVSERTKGIFNPANSVILQGAQIRFEASGRNLDKITYLELRRGGMAPSKGAKEFSANLLLDGKQGIVDGDVKVAEDYVTIADLTITGDLEIGRELENDFYGKGIEVQGNTIINGGDDNTVVFEGANLVSVDVNKTDVRVEALGQTFIQGMNLNVNSTIVGTSTASIDQLNVTGAAQQVNLQGTIGSVTVNTSSTITGTAKIGQMSVQTASPVTLSTTGTIANLNVAQPTAAITVGSNQMIGSLSTPSGVTPSTVISNYSTAQAQIGSPSPVNRAPVIRNPISNFTMTVGDTKIIDLSQVFEDADGNLSYYKALLVKAASAPELVTVTVEGNMLTIEAKLAGKITVRTQAYDTSNARINHDFAVTVNRNPVAADIPEQVSTLDAAASTLDLSAYFTDPDGDTLTYTAVSGDETVITASVSDKLLQLQALTLGHTTITVTAKDGKGGTIVKDFVVRANRSPQMLTPLTDRKASIGADLVVDLSNAFQDPDGDALTYEASSQDASSAAAVASGSTLTVTPLAEGPVSVTVTAKDGKGGTASQTFTVNVNYSPKLDQSADVQELMVGKGDAFVELNGMFGDVDGDPLTYEVQSASAAIVTAEIVAGNRIRLSPVSGGETTVTVSANDGNGGTTSGTFDVRVNEAPTIKQPVVERSIQLTGGDVTVNLVNVFQDVNADNLTLSVSESGDPSIVTVDLSGTTLTLTPVAAGNSAVTITADDGRGGQVSDSFVVRVNRAPQIAGSLADQLLTIENGEKTIDVSGVFHDLDGDVLTYQAVSADDSIAAVSVSGGEVTINPLAAGTVTITLTAIDGKGGQSSKSFEVTVNRTPIVNQAVTDRLITLGTGDITIDLSQVFLDEDGDAMTLAASSLSEELVSVSLDAVTNVLAIHPIAGGTATISIQAEDDRGGVKKHTFEVRVNQAPQAANLADRTLSLGSAAQKIDLSSFFTDADRDALTFSAVSADTSVVSVDVDGQQLSLTAAALGSTNVTITASDSRGGTVSTTMALEVQPNRSPVVNQTIDGQIVRTGREIEVDLTNVFNDPDGDALSYEAVSADDSVATVSAAGHLLTVSGIIDGAATITVTATDVAGNQVDTSFQVNASSNEWPEVVGSASEQMVVPGFTTQVALGSLFRDNDGDALTYSVQAAAGGMIVPSVEGNMLKLVSGTGSGPTQVTVTADDGRGGQASTTIQVTAVEIIHQKAIKTKVGIGNVSYSLPSSFPIQQTLTVYRAENGTLVKEDAPILNGSTLTMNPGSMVGMLSYVVITADGKAASVQLNVQQQQGAAAFFSEYSRENAMNIVLEMYNMKEEAINYQVIGYRYNLKTQQMERMLDRDYRPNLYANVYNIYKGNIGLVINNVFYEFMDRTQVPGYHDELVMNLDWDYKFDGYVVCAFELVLNGQVIDVLGDKNWTPASGAEPLPTTGTLIRKKGVATGSNAFSLEGEWDLLPFTLESVNKHTP